jgi:hypothetical protein
VKWQERFLSSKCSAFKGGLALFKIIPTQHDSFLSSNIINGHAASADRLTVLRLSLVDTQSAKNEAVDNRFPFPLKKSPMESINQRRRQFMGAAALSLKINLTT